MSKGEAQPRFSPKNKKKVCAVRLYIVVLIHSAREGRMSVRFAFAHKRYHWVAAEQTALFNLPLESGVVRTSERCRDRLSRWVGLAESS